MTSRKRAVRSRVLVALLWILAGRTGAAQIPAPVPAGLVVVASAHVTTLAPNHGVYDFGKVTLLEQIEATQTFLLSNEGNTTLDHLQIDSSSPACLHLSLVHTRLPGSDLEALVPATALPTILPGGQIAL